MIWLILSIAFWGFIHSLFASQKAKGLVRQVFGAAADRTYRLAYNIFACLSFLPVLIIAATTPDRLLYLVPLPWSVLSVAGQLLATAVLLIGFRQTDPWEFLGIRQVLNSAAQERLDGQQETQNGKLVTTGLYRYVRHPLYSAGVAFLWLMPLMTVNVLVINIGLTVYVIVGAIFEERKLLSTFGQAYADYAVVTPMLIPFIRWNKARR